MEMITFGFVTELFLFGTLKNKTFNQYINSSNIQNKNNCDDNSSNLVLKPPPNLNSFLINLITHLKPMISNTLKMLSSANITI